MTTICQTAAASASRCAPSPSPPRSPSPAGDSAVLLAPRAHHRAASGARDLAADPLASRSARAEAARAVQSALGGDPSALIAMVTLRMRDAKTSAGVAGANANAAAARDALSDEREARAASEAAARKAAEAAKASGLFSTIAKVAAVVVGVAATVCTAGAGAVVLAGALLLAFSDVVVDGLVKGGIVPPEAAESLALALKITGTLMMGPSALVGALSVTGAVISTYGNDLTDLLASAGVDEDFCGKLEIGLALAGAALSVGAGVGGACEAPAGGVEAAASAAQSSAARAGLDVVRATGSIIEGEATIGAAGMSVVAANHLRHSEHFQADAAEDRADADMAREEISVLCGSIRDDFKRAARLLRLARQIGEAHDRSMQAAARSRA